MRLRGGARLAPVDARVSAKGLGAAALGNMRGMALVVLLTALLVPVLPAMAQAEGAAEIEVKARKVDAGVIIDVSLLVQSTPRQAWDVLTDYDNMPRFLPNLTASKIISRSPKKLQVNQQGGVSRGPITLSFDVVREIDLEPYQEIRSRVVSGNLKKVDSTTRVTAEGSGTRITFHSESIPNVWVPPGIGPLLIEKEARRQFSDMREEILKRRSAAAPG